MKVVGLVVEYNPFHHGHLHHLQMSQQVTGADYVVCIMSGHILQRGEPALIDKWSRAAMAVANGADVVFELPYVYSGQSAETFATGAVSLLQSMGTVTHLAFGSETTDLDLLTPLVSILTDEPPGFKNHLRDSLQQGFSFPKARHIALQHYMQDNSNLYSLEDIRRAERALSRPNTILGIEYLKALYKSESYIRPVLIQRVGSEYHDPHLPRGRIASATAIRLKIQRAWQKRRSPAAREKVLLSLQDYLPETSFAELHHAIQNERGPVFAENFGQILQYALRSTSQLDLAETADLREGIENKIISASQGNPHWKDLLDHTVSKRFPRTTLQRILFQILLQYKKEDARLVRKAGPQYLRVLGFSNRGRLLLKEMKSKASLPVVHRITAFEKEVHSSWTPEQGKIALRMLALDRLSTDLYVLAFSDPDQRSAGQDYTFQLNPIKS